MADITMCNGLDCPTKDSCYRHTAPVNEFRQAYFQQPPWDGVDCTYYIQTEDKNETN